MEVLPPCWISHPGLCCYLLMWGSHSKNIRSMSHCRYFSFSMWDELLALPFPFNLFSSSELIVNLQKLCLETIGKARGSWPGMAPLQEAFLSSLSRAAFLWTQCEQSIDLSSATWNRWVWDCSQRVQGHKGGRIFHYHCQENLSINEKLLFVLYLYLYWTRLHPDCSSVGAWLCFIPFV